MTPDSAAQWIQYGAPGMLAVVLFFVGKAALKLLDRFAASIDKLDTTISNLLSHVQASAISEAASLERKHSEILAAVQGVQAAMLAAAERNRTDILADSARHHAGCSDLVAGASREIRAEIQAQAARLGGWKNE